MSYEKNEIYNKYISQHDLDTLITNFLLIFIRKQMFLNNDLIDLIINYLYDNNFVLNKLNDKRFRFINRPLNDKIAVNLDNIICKISYTSIYSFDPSLTLVLYPDKYITYFEYIENDIKEKINKYFQNNDIKYNSFIRKEGSIIIFLDYYQITKIKDDTNIIKNNKNISLSKLINNILNYYEIDIKLNCRILLDVVKRYNKNIYINWKLDYINNCELLD